jgi:hypothetical protein
MKEELKKSLTDLIDETLLELEELKKSRFAAAEIDLKGPGEGLAGKPSNGDLHAKKEDKDEDEEDMAEKAEGQNRQSDPNGSKHKPVAGEGMEHGQGPSQSPNSSKEHGQGKNSESDPGNTHWAQKSEGDEEHEATTKAEDDEDEKKDKKKDKDAKGGERHEAEEKKAVKKLADLAGMKKGDPSPEQVNADVQKLVMHGLKKSQEETESLLKGFVEERVRPLEDKLSTILDLVNKIADQPVPAKGYSASSVVPLRKNGEEGGVEELSKSEVASKLFDLKKSGTKVDSLDITRAEMGQDLAKIAAKYKIS